MQGNQFAGRAAADRTGYGNGMRATARLAATGRLPRNTVIALLLLVALFAFEVFNFDTTQYALESLLGSVNFIGLRWATILAIAFCAIDFAGLAHLFTPEKGLQEPKEIWYLMGAWLLGATMNAIMTWWAVSLTLLSHDFGNEVLSRQQLLTAVPVFVAVLVWLTRVLFIGAISVAGESLFQADGVAAAARPRPAAQPNVGAAAGANRTTANAYRPTMPRPRPGARPRPAAAAAARPGVPPTPAGPRRAPVTSRPHSAPGAMRSNSFRAGGGAPR